MFKSAILSALTLLSLGAASVTVTAPADGKTDATSALQSQINASAPGDVLSFGDASKVYLVSQMLTLLPGRTYSGAATLKMNPAVVSSGSLYDIAHAPNANGITISGLHFNSSGVVGGLAFTDSTLTPVQGLTIQNCTFQDTDSTAPGIYNGPISIPAGANGVTITGNAFLNSGQIYITNPRAVSITHNTFTGVLPGDDAINFGLYGPGATALTISDNTFTLLGRMGVEIQAHTQDSTVTGLHIDRNTFSNWRADADLSSDFGISIAVPAASTSTVSGNTITQGPNVSLSTGYGLEIGASGLVLDSNAINGFFSGIIVNNGTGVTVSNNHISGSTNDLSFAHNAPELNTQVLGNTLDTPITMALDIAGAICGGSVFTGNTSNGVNVDATGTAACGSSPPPVIPPVVPPVTPPTSGMFTTSTVINGTPVMITLNWGATTPPVTPPIIPPVVPPVTGTVTCPIPTDNAYTGCYYLGNFRDGRDMTVAALVNTPTVINYDWTTTPPSPAFTGEYSVEWAGNINLGGSKTFTVATGGGIRLFVDGSLVIDHWADPASPQTYSFTRTLSGGLHQIILDFHHGTGQPVVNLSIN